MILIPCPYCGPRNSSEFRHGGDSLPRPDVGTASPAQWRSYLYDRENPTGWTRETWYHGFGCRRFIAIERHRTTNEARPAADAGLDLPTAAGGDHAEDTGTTTGRLL